MKNQNNLLQLEEVVELAKSADDSDRHFFEQTIEDTGTEKVKSIQNQIFHIFFSQFSFDKRPKNYEKNQKD